VYFGAALIAMFLTPIVSRIAKAKGCVDVPGVRKVHKVPVARIGGIAFVAAMYAMVVPVLFLDNTVGAAFRHVQGQLTMLLIAGVFMFVVGLVDDLRSVRASIKLLCLVAASLAVCLSGARLQSINVPNCFQLDLGWGSWPVTVLWIVGVSVGMNFIDGLDGLAAGVAAIVCGTIAVFALFTGQIVMAVLMLALLGGLTGFLFFNFNPAKIFMGDGGSMFLGFMLGAGSVVCQAKTATLVGIAVPTLALGVPLLDAAFTMIRRRVLDRRSIFAAERGHLHHRLLDKGLRHRSVVFVVYGVTLLSAGVGLLALIARGGAAVAVFGGGVLFLFVVFSVVGSARIRETIAAIKRNRAIAFQVKREGNCFEDAQLRVREAKSFEEWWKAVCLMAEELEFEHVTLSMPADKGARNEVSWHLDREGPGPHRVVDLVMPIGGDETSSGAMLKVGVGVNGSLEAGGRRAALMGRLIDESGLLGAYVAEHFVREDGDGSFAAGHSGAGKAHGAPEKQAGSHEFVAEHTPHPAE
jgi:UDP-N-acetylmuramyl pentapeptide phosphotransferase/UDP-N-acetylglucosamine-1-phosphate transferase